MTADPDAHAETGIAAVVGEQNRTGVGDVAREGRNFKSAAGLCGAANPDAVAGASRNGAGIADAPGERRNRYRRAAKYCQAADLNAGAAAKRGNGARIVDAAAE